MTLQLPIVDSCYFCDIFEYRVSRWSVIYESDLIAILLNGRQFEVGQCMVVPIRHAPTLLDLSEEEDAAIMSAAKHLANVMIEAYDTDGILTYQNNGIGSGQEVPHYHMHIVPRRAESDWGFGPPHIARLEQGKLPMDHDHTVVTDGKTETIETVRQHLLDRLCTSMS